MARLTPVRGQRRIWRVAPEVTGSAFVIPVLIDVANHQVHLVSDGDVTADEILTSIDRLKSAKSPSLATQDRVRIGKSFTKAKPAGAEQVQRNTIAGEASGIGRVRTVESVQVIPGTMR